MNIEDYKKMQELYSKALEESSQTFEFKGRVLAVGYAKYLLEYLSNQFQKNLDEK